MADETVLCKLNWTYGVNVNGRTVYFGPGLVPVPRDIARRKGWWTPPSTSSGTEEEETAVSDDTAVESGDVRARTDEAILPDPEFIEEKTDYPVGEVAAVAGVSHLLDALIDAGFIWASSIANASEKDLTAVSGIGKVTAQKLQKAAVELLGDSA